jgi:hypothetical protein
MTYQVVSSHRTGSTLLNLFCINNNEGFGFSELFLEPSYTRMSFLDSASMEEKFEFLEYYKKKDIHFSIKIFPKKIIDRGYEEKLYNYLDGYKILTIRRDPFDAFLSESYQKATNWKIAHRKTIHGKTPDTLLEQPFEIDYDSVNGFIDKWNVNYGFVKKLNVHKTFDYHELTINNLQQYFNTNYAPDIIPHNIDYEKYVKNLKSVREYFNEQVCSIL